MTDSQRWFFLSISLITLALIYLLAPILTPFLAGALLAYICDPVADRLEAKGMSRTLAVVTVFVGLTALIAVLVLLLLPNLGYQIKVMVQQIPVGLALLEQRVLPWLQTTLGVNPDVFDLAHLKQLISSDWQQAGNLMKQILNGVSRSGLALAGWIANLVLIPVVTFYLLRDWDLMMERIHHLLPRNIERRVQLWAQECDEVLGAFIKGQLLVMLALGVVYALGLWLIGLDLALLIGMLAGLASIVPYMGFIIGIAAAGVAAFMQFQDPMMLLWVAAVFGVGQALEGMLLTPLLVGDRIGLHPVAVIFAIMAGGQLFGFVGVLLALPVAAVVMVLLRHLHDGYKSSSLYSQYSEKPQEDNDNEQSA
ncbi:AI-2E family transporter [Marinobacterium sp. CAU 1594]|nr:AI-2E family transporter [Marinobacterium arenosum]